MNQHNFTTNMKLYVKDASVCQLTPKKTEQCSPLPSAIKPVWSMWVIDNKTNQRNQILLFGKGDKCFDVYLLDAKNLSIQKGFRKLCPPALDKFSQEIRQNPDFEKNPIHHQAEILFKQLQR